MSGNDYVLSVIKKHALSTQIEMATERDVIIPLKRIIENWAGNSLCEVKISGSRAKGTAVDLSTDLDLFISLSSTLNKQLGDIYESLFTRMHSEGLNARKQNVSIGITYKGKKVDLVPAKRQGQYGGDHSLYKNKTSTWTKTNIDTHISKVIHSGRRNEIIALKVWRENHKLEFPSVFLEMLTIDALQGRGTNDTAGNFWYMLRYLKEHICTKRVLDPANTNNVLSEELSAYEKKQICIQAGISLEEQCWSKIIW